MSECLVIVIVIVLCGMGRALLAVVLFYHLFQAMLKRPVYTIYDTVIDVFSSVRPSVFLSVFVSFVLGALAY